MAKFRPYNAASSLSAALEGPTPIAGILWSIFYAVGVLACTFHLANGIWTAGITWGVWLTPKSQRRASIACALFGLFIGTAGLSALVAAKTTNKEAAAKDENEMYDARIQAHSITPNDHKRSAPHTVEEPKPVPVQP